MIPARKDRIVGPLLSWDAARRLRSRFEAVRVLGLPHLTESLAAGPVLVVSNHTSWWDPLIAIMLTTRVVAADAYAMMDAVNLQRFPFFARVGAFGVDLTDPADGARALRYASKLLDRPGRLVWIFPQGREVPLSPRPLAFKGGSAELARLAKTARVIPIGLRYEMGATPDPTAWIAIGAPLAATREIAAARAAQEAAVTRALDRIDAAIHGVGAGDSTEREATTDIVRRDRASGPGVLARWLAALTAPKARIADGHDSTSK